MILAIWGIAASYRHYAAGDQMLTFFIVEMVFTLFITLPPVKSLIMISSAHIAFYLTLDHYDMAVRLNALNYTALALLLWASALSIPKIPYPVSC